MNRRHFLRAVSALLPLAPLAAFATDDDDDDQDFAREAVRLRRVLPLYRILERVRSIIAGTIVDVSLEQRGGRYEYRFKYINARGQVLEIRFDARTAALLD